MPSRLLMPPTEASIAGSEASCMASRSDAHT
jgi:hypothetical protein